MEKNENYFFLSGTILISIIIFSILLIVITSIILINIKRKQIMVLVPPPINPNIPQLNPPTNLSIEPSIIGSLTKWVLSWDPDFNNSPNINVIYEWGLSNNLNLLPFQSGKTDRNFVELEENLIEPLQPYYLSVIASAQNNTATPSTRVSNLIYPSPQLKEVCLLNSDNGKLQFGIKLIKPLLDQNLALFSVNISKSFADIQNPTTKISTRGTVNQIIYCKNGTTNNLVSFDKIKMQQITNSFRDNSCSLKIESGTSFFQFDCTFPQNLIVKNSIVSFQIYLVNNLNPSQFVIIGPFNITF